MNRVSSSLTVILRIALPTIWFVSILSLLILLSWAVSGRAQLFSFPLVWAGMLLIIGCGASFIYFLLWKLYRVDMDDQSIYVSNYFRTYRYPFRDIQSIRGISVAPNRIFRIELKSKGSFGKNIYFLASQKLWQDYIQTHPLQLKDILT
jgi:hypothetical protein